MREFIAALRPLPILKVAISFGLGIIFGNSCFISPWIWGITAATFLFIACIGFYWNTYTNRWLFGFGVGIFFVCFGGFYVTSAKIKHVDLDNTQQVNLILSVDDNPIKTRYGSRWNSRIVSIDDSLAYLKGERTIVYCRADSIPQVGKLIYASANISSISAPKNPFEFSFKEYYSRQQVYLQTAIYQNGYVTIGDSQLSPVLRFSCYLQRYTLSTLQKYGLEGSQLGVVLALMIGDKQFLDADTKDAYTNIGAMHILAVSGMHVALIYGILVWLLFFLHGRKGQLIQGIAILFSLWIYALVAGFSPSIVRATIMFSFIAVGKMLGRDYNTYNLLAASFLLQLLLSPLVLFDVGFQLSYAAVLSILLFQPFFKRWKPKRRFFRLIYDMIIVTIAAQVLTFPLVIYYFHQFPLTFLLTNLILIPITSSIIYLTLILLVVAWWVPVAKMLSYIIVAITQFANNTAMFFASLPSAVIDGVQIESWQMVLLVVSLLFFYIFVLYKNSKTLLVSLSLMMLVVSYSLINNFKCLNSKVVVYYVKNGSALLFTNGQNNFCLTDSLRDNAAYKYMDPSLITWRLGNHKKVIFKDYESQISSPFFIYRDGWCSFKDKTFYICRHQIVQLKKPAKTRFAIDYLIISKGTRGNPLHLLNLLNPHTIIIDGNISKYQSEKWTKYCKEHNIPFWDVKHSGALVLEL